MNFSTYETMVFSNKGVDANCYGLSIVQARMRALGKRYDPAAPDVTLHSSYWPEQLIDLYRWKAKAPAGRPILVGGNSPTTNPAPYLEAGCHVFLGDGECYADDSPSLLAPTNDAPRPIAVAETIYPYAGYEDVQNEKSKAARYFCEISRGCKNKCAFCQYGWLKPYRECAVPHVEATLRYATTKHVRVFAADRFQHSQYPQIRLHLEKLHAIDTGSDMSIRFVNEHPEYLKFTRKFRTGIEGMSFRLRTLMGKRISDDDIIKAHAAAVDAGIRSFDWYMIYGLIGETDADVDAFLDLLSKLQTVMKGQTLAIHWNAYQPNAMTPLQWAAPAFRYPRKRLDRIAASRFNFKLMNVPLHTGDELIARRVLVGRAGGRETADLLRVLAYKPSAGKDVDGLRAAYRKKMGVDLFGEWPAEKPFPWDRHVEYRRAKMRAIYESIRRRAGLAA